LGAVFAELLHLVVFEDTKGFAGEVGAVDVGGVEDVAEFVAGEAIEVDIVGINFGVENSAIYGFWADEGAIA
jgi:hypothetical protein